MRFEIWLIWCISIQLNYLNECCERRRTVPSMEFRTLSFLCVFLSIIFLNGLKRGISRYFECISSRIFLGIAGVGAIDCSIDQKNAEGQLKKSILCNYDKSSRPVDEKVEIDLRVYIKSFSYADYLRKLYASAFVIVVRRANGSSRECELHNFEFWTHSVGTTNACHGIPPITRT